MAKSAAFTTPALHEQNVLLLQVAYLPSSRGSDGDRVGSVWRSLEQVRPRCHLTLKPSEVDALSQTCMVVHC